MAKTKKPRKKTYDGAKRLTVAREKYYRQIFVANGNMIAEGVQVYNHTSINGHRVPAQQLGLWLRELLARPQMWSIIFYAFYIDPKSGLRRHHEYRLLADKKKTFDQFIEDCKSWLDDHTNNLPTDVISWGWLVTMSDYVDVEATSLAGAEWFAAQGAYDVAHCDRVDTIRGLTESLEPIEEIA